MADVQAIAITHIRFGSREPLGNSFLTGAQLILNSRAPLFYTNITRTDIKIFFLR